MAAREKAKSKAKKDEKAGSETGSRSSSTLREYGEALVMAIVLALFIRTFVVQAFKIPSGSMLPTLEIGDHLLVNKFIYGVRVPFVGKRIMEIGSPDYDDVIVFIYPQDRSKDFIKRVQALPGDEIELRNKALYVNGERVPDEFAHYEPIPARSARTPRDDFGPETVPEGHVFVMGDNRDHSHDSRFWGMVPINDILGKAFLLYWSWDGNALRPRWSRLGMRIPS